MRRVRQVLARTAATTVDWLFPPVCPACPCRVARHGGLCAACWHEVRFLERPWCECHGIPFALDLGHGALSAEAIARPPVFGRARAAVAYDGPAARLVRALKFHDRTELAPMMAGWMMRVGRELARDGPLVVPVPLHRRRLLQRRYNQSAELARCFAALGRLEFAPDVVARVRGTRQQVGLDSRQRESNVRGAFGVPVPARRLRGRRVLLIDDVYTTGATVSAAARALKRGGAASVDVLTFARVLPRDFAA